MARPPTDAPTATQGGPKLGMPARPAGAPGSPPPGDPPPGSRSSSDGRYLLALAAIVAVGVIQDG